MVVVRRWCGDGTVAYSGFGDQQSSGGQVVSVQWWWPASIDASRLRRGPLENMSMRRGSTWHTALERGIADNALRSRRGVVVTTRRQRKMVGVDEACRQVASKTCHHGAVM